MSFLPKDLLYNESNYKNSNENLLAAIEILEKAQSNKEKNISQHPQHEKKEEGFWSKLFKPFKCGSNN
jgi:hypothetical protein